MSQFETQVNDLIENLKPTSKEEAEKTVEDLKVIYEAAKAKITQLGIDFGLYVYFEDGQWTDGEGWNGGNWNASSIGCW